ncbi:MAG: hypothetical protein HY755_09655 [Nitrospirae bacterium]|nr:hypothetical protein [Nitrospirota bacterium]
MKSGKAAKKAVYIGAGAGLALFGLIGLLRSSLLGGIIGMKIAGGLFGFPLTSNLLPRLTVGISMLLGVLVTGSVFAACGAMTGWTIEQVIDSLKTSKVFRYNLNTSFFSGSTKKLRHNKKREKGKDG